MHTGPIALTDRQLDAVTAGGPGIEVTTAATATGSAALTLTNAGAMAAKVPVLRGAARPGAGRGSGAATPARPVGTADLVYGWGEAFAAGATHAAACVIESEMPTAGGSASWSRERKEVTADSSRCQCDAILVSTASDRPEAFGPREAAGAALDVRVVQVSVPVSVVTALDP
jgi:hypothetical protein